MHNLVIFRCAFLFRCLMCHLYRSENKLNNGFFFSKPLATVIKQSRPIFRHCALCSFSIHRFDRNHTLTRLRVVPLSAEKNTLKLPRCWKYPWQPCLFPFMWHFQGGHWKVTWKFPCSFPSLSEAKCATLTRFIFSFFSVKRHVWLRQWLHHLASRQTKHSCVTLPVQTPRTNQMVCFARGNSIPR